MALGKKKKNLVILMVNLMRLHLKCYSKIGPSNWKVQGWGLERNDDAVCHSFCPTVMLLNAE